MHVASILLAFGIAAGTTLVAAGMILVASGSSEGSRRWPLFARGDGRPIGGPAVIIGIIIAGVSIAHTVEAFIALGVVAAILVGVVDDLYDISPWQKLGGQALAAGLAAIGFARLAPALPLITGVASFVWIVVLFNAINLIDGLDGLLIGSITPGLIALSIAGFVSGDPLATVRAATTCGALVAFFPFNHSRARLLLGDTGAEFVGFSVALITISMFTKRPTVLAIPAMLLISGLPIADTAFAVIRRTANHRSIFTGDRDHIHHRLARRLGEQKAVVLLSAVSSIAAVAALILLLIAH
jgi:UDP-GlcNAc:undecaprenyl-phosphate/decaprenyl-phosphate GlcNAc-1-phosphate transferase